ncbi:MAG: hypothetical protein PVSMB9_10640 [Candidatus Dormibacteria bacterium]
MVPVIAGTSRRLRLAVGLLLVALGSFGALTGIFFTGMTPDGQLAQLSGAGRALPSAVLIIGGILVAAASRRRDG